MEDRASNKEKLRLAEAIAIKRAADLEANNHLPDHCSVCSQDYKAP
jgi:hypothetical protein